MTLNLNPAAPSCSWTSRLYENEDDFEQMQAMLIEARRQTDDWRYWHIGELIWSFFMVDCHLNPREFIRLWHNADGNLIGYALLGDGPYFDCQVLPGYVWRGIETEALAWVETHLSDLPQQEAQPWSEHFVSGTRQDDAKRIAFLEWHGFRPGEYAEVNMLRSLNEPIPEAPLPAGYQVRSVDEAEISDRAAAQREVWQPWTVGNVSDDDYARFMQLPGYHRDLDVVAVTPEGVIAAYVNGWIDPVNRIGDFGPVGARLAYRRRGLTRLALLEGLRRMQANGMDRVCVSTGVGNMPAQKLYESIGFQIVNKYIEYVKPGGDLPLQL